VCEDQVGGHEGGEDRRCAKVAYHWQALADLGAAEPAESEHRNHHREIAGNFPVLQNKEGYKSRKQNIDRQRHDADTEVDQPPPALRPVALGSAL
jgi:hypothetical protein